MTIDTKAIRARAAAGVPREQYIMQGPAFAGRLTDAVMRDCVALCDEVDSLRARLAEREARARYLSQTLQGLEATVYGQQARIAELKAALLVLEWCMRAIDDGPSCPQCAHAMYFGHSATCIVGAALARPDDASALREFGVKCVVRARSEPSEPDVQAVDAVLAGER